MTVPLHVKDASAQGRDVFGTVVFDFMSMSRKNHWIFRLVRIGFLIPAEVTLRYCREYEVRGLAAYCDSGLCRRD